MKFVLGLLILSSTALATSDCVPAHEEIAFEHDGLYHRIHPSGNYFLYTDDSKSILVDVTDRNNPKKLVSPLREETYPVESARGEWDLIASPVGGGSMGPHEGMDYFRFSDILDSNRKTAKPTYTDPQHGEFYHSTAELPGSTKNVKKVRTLLYTDRYFRDYEMKMSQDGKVVSVKKSEIKKICDNIFKPVPKDPEYIARKEKRGSEIQLARDKVTRAVRENAKPSVIEELRADLESLIKQDQLESYGPEFVRLNKLSDDLQDQSRELYKKFTSTSNYGDLESQSTRLQRLMNKIDGQIFEQPNYKKIIDRLTDIENAKTNASGSRLVQLERQEERVSEELRLYYEAEKKKTNYKDLYRENRQILRHMRKLESSTPEGQEYSQVKLRAAEVINKITEIKYGVVLANPVVSKDGTHVAGLVGISVKVYKINDDGNCEQVADTKIRGSKVSFSYPKPNESLKITFTNESFGDQDTNVYVYDLEDKSAQIVSVDQDLESYYPGFLLDGRVMYKTEKGMAIVDPNQTTGHQDKCIHPSSTKSSSSSQTQKAGAVK